MRVEALEPVGARVEGLSLAEVTPEEVGGLRDLLAEHGVVILPAQDPSDEVFVAFLSAFGALAFTTGETHVDGHPDLNVVSNVGRTTPPKSTFHVDTSYVPRPPAYTALRAVTLPEQGGATLFTNQYRAYETLPVDAREHLMDRTITHVATGVQDESSAEHPVFREHPISGRVALYLSTPKRCAAISGMTAEEAEATVAELFAHSTRPENTLRHEWSPGDVVMWDNAVVLHRADHDGVVGDRVMHRGMVAG